MVGIRGDIYRDRTGDVTTFPAGTEVMVLGPGEKENTSVILELAFQEDTDMTQQVEIDDSSLEALHYIGNVHKMIKNS